MAFADSRFNRKDRHSISKYIVKEREINFSEMQ